MCPPCCWTTHSSRRRHWSRHKLVTHLVLFKRFDQLFTCSQQSYARSRMFLVIEVHIQPRLVDSVQNLFHVHLFHRLLDDVLHLVFELVKIKWHEIWQRRTFVQGKPNLYHTITGFLQWRNGKVWIGSEKTLRFISCRNRKQEEAQLDGWPSDAAGPLKSCQLLYNCTKNRLWKILQYVNDTEGDPTYRKWRYSIDHTLLLISTL